MTLSALALWIGLGIAILLMLAARFQGATGADQRHGSTYRWLFIGGCYVVLAWFALWARLRPPQE